MICTLTIEQREEGVSVAINYGDTTNLESPNHAQKTMAVIAQFTDNLLKGNYPNELVAGIMSVGQAVENDD